MSPSRRSLIAAVAGLLSPACFLSHGHEREAAPEVTSPPSAVRPDQPVADVPTHAVVPEDLGRLRGEVRNLSVVMENFQGWTETFGTWVSFDLWLENQTRSPVTEVAIESGLLSTLAALDRGVELPLHFVFDDRSGYDPFTPTGPSETHTYRFTAVTENHPDVCRSGVVTPVQVDLEIVTDVESLGLVAMPVRPSCVWTE